jgi:hypothetical protein
MLEGADLLASELGATLLREQILSATPYPSIFQPWEVSAAWVRQAKPDDGIGWLLSILKQAANMITE